jgi:amyloid beta precursor protein binding protein 1
MSSADLLPPPVQDAIAVEDAPAQLATGGSSARPDAHTQRYDRQLRLAFLAASYLA